MSRLAQAGVAVLLLAAGCAPARRPPDEVVFWQFSPPAAVEPLARRFEVENPGVHVRIEQLVRSGASDSVAAALARGTPPDLCVVDGEHMPALLASGALSDWSAGVADQRDSLRGWEVCRVGDAIYGMPWRVFPQVLFWNRGLFARAGLDSARAPATWDQLAAAASRLQRLKGAAHGYGLAMGDSTRMLPEFLSFAWGNGGEVLSAGGDSSRFDSPQNVEALEFALRLRKSSLQQPGDHLDAEFAAGRLGMRVADARLAARLDRQAPGLRFGVAAVPSPSRDGAMSGPFADVSVLVSFTRSRHKEHALRLARFLVRPGNSAESYAAEPEGVPANAGADTLAWLGGSPRAALLAAQAGRARFTPEQLAWNEMARAIADELDRAMRGEKPASVAVADAGARLAALAGRR